MNREIKFRVWDNHCEYFINFDFSHPHFDDDANQVTFDCDKVMGDHGGLERFTFQQFTGLKDKNGKEIYEGDIVQLHCGGFGRMKITATIEWYEYKWCANIHDKVLTVAGGASDGKLCSMAEIHSWAGMHSCFTQGWGYIEVIGNIYENPSLLQ